MQAGQRKKQMVNKSIAGMSKSGRLSNNRCEATIPHQVTLSVLLSVKQRSPCKDFLARQQTILYSLKTVLSDNYHH